MGGLPLPGLFFFFWLCRLLMGMGERLSQVPAFAATASFVENSLFTERRWPLVTAAALLSESRPQPLTETAGPRATSYFQRLPCPSCGSRAEVLCGPRSPSSLGPVGYEAPQQPQEHPVFCRLSPASAFDFCQSVHVSQNSLIFMYYVYNTYCIASIGENYPFL